MKMSYFQFESSLNPDFPSPKTISASRPHFSSDSLGMEPGDEARLKAQTLSKRLTFT